MQGPVERQLSMRASITESEIRIERSKKCNIKSGVADTSKEKPKEITGLEANAEPARKSVTVASQDEEGDGLKY